MELLKEESASLHNSETDLVSHEDTQPLCEFLAESMRNHIHKVNGHKNRYRFNSYTTRLARNQLLISGKSRYEQNRDESLIVMPASGGLLHTKQQQKICVGDCIVLYEKQLLLRGRYMIFR